MPSLHIRRKRKSKLSEDAVLHEVNETYHETLCKVGLAVGMDILPPRKKLSVLVIGNHSAGKSSFINWYMGGVHANDTGVACESIGFNICTMGSSSKKVVQEVRGEGVLRFYPQLSQLPQFGGRNIMDYVTVSVVPKIETDNKYDRTQHFFHSVGS